MMRRAASVVSVLVMLGMFLRSQAAAAGAGSIQTYSGDFLTRSTLLGDWGGPRNDWAAKGITLNGNVTQIEQGVVSGGKSGIWEYGGRGDVTGNLDTQKLGLWPGGFLTVELEANWGAGVNNKTGALLPANTNQILPIPGGDNVAIPDLSVAQFLSHYVGLTAGKLQTISQGDLNEFAHGKGDTQFLNVAFNVNPALLLVPYSTLAAGVIVLPTADPNEAIVKFVVTSATGKASTAGFDDINGALFVAEGRMRTGFFGLTGHQLVGAVYSNKTYTSLDQRLSSIIGNRPLTKRDGSWSVYYNFDQYLYQPKKDVDQGVGVFARFGASEGDPVPVQYFYSIGFGGKGVIPDRSLDQCGIGYYYSSISNPTLVTPFSTRSFLRDEWGFEGYYNVALTPWFLVTPDVQVIGPSQKQEFTGLRATKNIGTATVLGLRGQVIF